MFTRSKTGRTAGPVVAFACCVALPQQAAAQSASLFPGSADTHRTSILSQPQGQRPAGVPAPTGPGAEPRTASLFVGTAGRSLFAPLPDRAAHSPRSAPQRYPALLPGKGSAERLRHLIAEAEAGRAGYDAVNHGARIKPPRRPTDMTVGEIYAWIAETPGQPHAIGRYQFIPSTLRRLVKAQGIDRAARFTPALQDRLADQLLVEAGLMRMERGEITRRKFMYRLAQIWAGLPLPSGKSYYQGVAGNKATMSWSRFEQGMTQIYPG